MADFRYLPYLCQLFKFEQKPNEQTTTAHTTITKSSPTSSPSKQPVLRALKTVAFHELKQYRDENISYTRIHTYKNTHTRNTLAHLVVGSHCSLPGWPPQLCYSRNALPLWGSLLKYSHTQGESGSQGTASSPLSVTRAVGPCVRSSRA